MLAAIAVAVFILLVPGAVLGWASGLRPTLALASAGPLMLGVTGFSAWLSHVLGLDYTWLFVGMVLCHWLSGAQIYPPGNARRRLRFRRCHRDDCRRSYGSRLDARQDRA